MNPQEQSTQSSYSLIQESLKREQIPFVADMVEGMSPTVEEDLVEVINMDPAVLEYYAFDAVKVREEALTTSGSRQNDLIAEFVAYEPFRHIGIIRKGAEIAKRRPEADTPEYAAMFAEMSRYHLTIARQAIETYINYCEDKDPVTLWNYYELLLSQLYEEANKHPEDPTFINSVIEDIALYKELQDNIRLPQ